MTWDQAIQSAELLANMTDIQKTAILLVNGISPQDLKLLQQFIQSSETSSPLLQNISKLAALK